MVRRGQAVRVLEVAVLHADARGIGVHQRGEAFDAAGRVLGHGVPPYLNLGRNAVIKQFLDEYPRDVRALLSLDSDNTFKPEQAYEVLSHLSPERPVVSGLYFAWNAEKFMPRPLIIQNGKTLWDYPENSLEWSDSCGMGFCAIHRDWLEEWRAKHGDTWFDFRGTGKSSPGGFAIEDRAFCERVWQTGRKVHVHTGILIGHDKQVNVNEKLYRALRAQAGELVITPCEIPAPLPNS